MEEINTNQIPVSQPSISNLPTQNNKNIYKYLFFIAIVVLLGVIVGFYFLLNNKIKQLETKQIVEITPAVEEISTIPTKTEVTPTTKSTESTLVEKDANNNLYTNNKIGFSLIIPKLTLSSIECKKEADSYRPASGLVPVTFFENNETIYLAADNFYHLTGEQKIYQGQGYTTNFSGCEKLKTSFDLIEKDRISSANVSSLKIYATNIKNDSELESYFKSKYGAGCRLGEKTLSGKDTYTVKILGDGKGLDESQCPINFAIVTQYNPIKGKLVIFELGQACNLTREYTGGCDDLEIMKSFKFN